MASCMHPACALCLFLLLLRVLARTSPLQLGVHSSSRNPVLTIGTALTLNYEDADYDNSQQMLNAWTIAVELMNREAGGVVIGGQKHEIRLIIDDDSSNATAPDTASLLLGPWSDQRVDDLIASGATTDKVIVTDAPGDYSSKSNVFSFRENLYLKILSMFLQSIAGKASSLAVLQEPGWEMHCDGLASLIGPLGLNVVYTGTIQTDSSDGSFETTLGNMASASPDAVLACTGTAGAKRFLLESKALGASGFFPEAIFFPAAHLPHLHNLVNMAGLDATYAVGINCFLDHGIPLSFYANYSRSRFIEEYRYKYFTRPGRAAAHAFTALELMLQAVKVADNMSASHVQAALQTLQSQTIIGLIDFNTGALGETCSLVQIQPFDTSLSLVWPDSIKETSLVYPARAWAVRNCTFGLNQYFRYGFADDMSSCIRCPTNAAASWSQTDQVRVCVTCPPGTTYVEWEPDQSECHRDCPPGEVHLDPSDSSCTKCSPGTYKSEDERPICLSCPMGRFSNSSGAANSSSCEMCAPGKHLSVTGGVECLNCSAGSAAGQDGMWYCSLCEVGRHSNQDGLTECSICPPGKAAHEIGESQCEMCAPGKYSERLSVRCEDCPIGKYNPQPEKIACIEDTLASRSSQPGMVTPSNSRTYFIFMESMTGATDEAKPERCKVSPEACLENDKCATGSTGRQCFACLPGYSRTGGKCTPCGSQWFGAFIIIFYIFGVQIAAVLGNPGTGSQEVHSILPKILLNHFIAVCLLGSAMMDYAVQVGEVATPDEVATVSKVDGGHQSMIGFLMIFDGFPDMETQFFSLTCLFSSTSPEQEKLFDSIAADAASSFYTDTLAEARDALIEWHTRFIYERIFWSNMLPIVVLAMSFLAAYVIVSFNMRIYADYWQKAMDFYAKVYCFGWRFTTGAGLGYEDKAVQRELMDMYKMNFFGIYWPVRYAKSYSKPAKLPCTLLRKIPGLKVFHVVSVKLVWKDHAIVRMLIGFSMYLSLARRSLIKCVHLSEQGGTHARVVQNHGIVDCSPGQTIYIVSMLIGTAWSVGYPLALMHWLRKESHRLDKPQVLRRWSILCNGYQKNRWWWEGVIFLRKQVMLMIEFLLVHDTIIRFYLHFFLALVAIMVQTIYRPYDARRRNLLNKMEMYQLCVWCLIAFANIVSAVGMIDFKLTVLFAFLLHIKFSLVMAYLMARSLFFAYFSRLNMAEVAGRESIVTREFLLMMGRIVQRRQIQQPYVSMDHFYGFAGVVGNRGDEAVPPYIPRGLQLQELRYSKKNLSAGRAAHVETGGVMMDYRSRFSEVPALPDVEKLPTPGKIRRATKGDVLTVTNYIMSIVQHLVCNHGLDSASFSASICDFVIRAAFLSVRASEMSDRGLHQHMAPQEVERKVWLAANMAHDPVKLTDEGHDDSGNQMQMDEHSDDAEEEHLSPEERELACDGRFMLRDLQLHEDLVKSWNAYSLCMHVSQKARKGGRLTVTAEDFAKYVPHQHHEGENAEDHSDSEGSGSGDENEVEPDNTENIEAFYTAKVTSMFSPSLLRRGMTFQDLQAAMVYLQSVPANEMKVWIDIFERVWRQENLLSDHELKRLALKFAETMVQTEDPDDLSDCFSSLEGEEAEEEAILPPRVDGWEALTAEEWEAISEREKELAMRWSSIAMRFADMKGTNSVIIAMSEAFAKRERRARGVQRKMRDGGGHPPQHNSKQFNARPKDDVGLQYEAMEATSGAVAEREAVESLEEFLEKEATAGVPFEREGTRASI